MFALAESGSITGHVYVAAGAATVRSKPSSGSRVQRSGIN